MNKKKEEPIVETLKAEVKAARKEIRQGRFQRSMAVIAAFAAIVSGFEAYVQHQRGAFKNKWMWTPVALTPPMMAAAGAAVASRRAARRWLPWAAGASVLDGVIGFYFHLRGVQRLPGGFKIGIYNVVMGPPIFAPLLMSLVGILGGFASLLRPERLEDFEVQEAKTKRPGSRIQKLISQKSNSAAAQPLQRSQLRRDGQGSPASQPVEKVESEVAHGQFQQAMAVTAASLAVLAGGEAYFEHMRGSYNQRVMWTPVWVTPPMVAAAVGAVRSRKIAHHVLPVASLVTFVDGLLGFGLHLRGLKRMPGGFHNMAFNVTMGPPLFAPLLFSAVGLLGFIASLLRRSH